MSEVGGWDGFTLGFLLAADAAFVFFGVAVGAGAVVTVSAIFLTSENRTPRPSKLMLWLAAHYHDWRSVLPLDFENLRVDLRSCYRVIFASGLEKTRSLYTLENPEICSRHVGSQLHNWFISEVLTDVNVRLAKIGDSSVIAVTLFGETCEKHCTLVTYSLP